VEFNDRNAILLQKGATGPELKLPGPPTNWLAPTRKVAKGEPLFIEVNNPGGWDEYTYRPEFATKGEKKYVRHVLPAGASPVPEVDGKRMVGPWEFLEDEKTWETTTSTMGLAKLNPFQTQDVGNWTAIFFVGWGLLLKG
jgi:hypothetical protein